MLFAAMKRIAIILLVTGLALVLSNLGNTPSLSHGEGVRFQRESVGAKLPAEAHERATKKNIESELLEDKEEQTTSTACLSLTRYVLSSESLQMFDSHDHLLKGHELERANDELSRVVSENESLSFFKGCRFSSGHPLNEKQMAFSASCHSILKSDSSGVDLKIPSTECLSAFFLYRASLIDYETREISPQEIKDPSVIVAKVYSEKNKQEPSSSALGALADQLSLLEPQNEEDIRLIIDAPFAILSGSAEEPTLE